MAKRDESTNRIIGIVKRYMWYLTMVRILRWSLMPTMLIFAMLAYTEDLLAAPSQIQIFKSTSGRTNIVYFTYDAVHCVPSGVGCNFRGTVNVPKGFEQVEVFLSGFKLETENQSDTVSRVTAAVHKVLYDGGSGDLELSVVAFLHTGNNQKYSYSLTFVVVLTDSRSAKFTPISGGCAGRANCQITKTLPAAVPGSLKYIGVATQGWDLASKSGPLVLNTLSAYTYSLNVQPPQVDIQYLCEIRDRIGNNRMSCEWTAKAIAFDPAEMEQNGAPPFPQYTFTSLRTNTRQFWTSNFPSPSPNPIPGFLDAFEGLTLTYQIFLPRPPAPVQNRVWLIESSAGNFNISSSAPNVAHTDYGIFLGTQFGNNHVAQQYAYQESRAFGFLR